MLVDRTDPFDETTPVEGTVDVPPQDVPAAEPAPAR